MGLFDKKYCDFCGEQIGLLGSHYKLADGNMCKTCMKELSPWLIRKKEYTVMDMQAHLDSRKYNSQLLDAFQASRVVGTNWKLFIDDTQGLFCLSRSGDYRSENADVFYMSQIIGCDMEIKEEEHRTAQTAPPPPGPEPRPEPLRPQQPVPPRPHQPVPPRPQQPVPPRPHQPEPPRPHQPEPRRQTPPSVPGGRPRREDPMDRGRMEGPSGRDMSGGPSGRRMTEGPAERGRSEGPSGRGRSEGPSGRGRSEGPSGGRGSQRGQGGRGPARPAAVPPNPQIVVPMIYYTYDYYIHLYLNHDWIPKITLKINSMEVTDRDKTLRKRLEAELTEFRDAILALKEQAAQYTGTSADTVGQTVTETASGTAAAEVTCPYCGTVTTPDTDGCCTSCGKYLGQ